MTRKLHLASWRSAPSCLCQAQLICKESSSKSNAGSILFTVTSCMPNRGRQVSGQTDTSFQETENENWSFLKAVLTCYHQLDKISKFCILVTLCNSGPYRGHRSSSSQHRMIFLDHSDTCCPYRERTALACWHWTLKDFFFLGRIKAQWWVSEKNL